MRSFGPGAPQRPINGDGVSTASLVSQAATQLSTLVRTELALAKTELAQKGKRFGMGGGLLAGAGILAGFGFALLLTLAVVLLDRVWPLWAAVLTVMVACFLIAGLAAVFGRYQLMRAAPGVPEAAQSVKQDLNVVKDAFHDGRHPDDRWYRYEGPADRTGRAQQGQAAGRGQGYNQQNEYRESRGAEEYGPSAYETSDEEMARYQSSEAGWGTQIRSDQRGEGWR
jgi:uncharacterized membrane protein YqjE